MKKWLVLVLSVLFLAHSYGQGGLYYLENEYNEDPFDELTYYAAGFNYLSNNVYLGRKDSTRLPYLSPYIGYNLHNGLYARATISYAPVKKTGHFDVLTLEAGYDHSFGKHVLTGISIEKYFYYKKSPGIRASTKDNISLYCMYKNETIEPQFTFAVNQGKSSDVVTGLSFDHNFRFVDNTLNVFPTVAFNMGSQHYYNDYFMAKLLKKDINLPEYEVVNDAGGIKPLDIEFSAKTTYRTTSWLFTLVPTYAVPLSAASIRLPNRTLTEKLSSSFYVSLDICYRHERK